MATINLEDIKRMYADSPRWTKVLALIEINNTLDEKLNKLVQSNKVIEGIIPNA